MVKHEKKIIWIDDERDMLKACKRILTKAGYKVDIFNNCFKALDALNKKKYDLLITGKVNAEMDGVEIIKRANKINPKMKKMMATGTVEGGKVIEGDGLDQGMEGCSAVLGKPFSVEDLLANIKKVLEYKIYPRMYSLPKLGSRSIYENGIDPDSGVNWNELDQIIDKYKVNLNKGSVKREQIAKRISEQCFFMDKVLINDVYTLNNDKNLCIKGTFYSSLMDGDLVDGEESYEYNFVAIFMRASNTLLIKDFSELLYVLLIKGQYYFVIEWVKARSCGRLMIVYALEGEFLRKIFQDSDRDEWKWTVVE